MSALALCWASLVSAILVGCNAPVAPENQLDDVFFIMNEPDAVALLGDSVHLQVGIKDPLPRPVTADVVWSSADPDVATVSSEGIVKIRQPGTTVVTATYLNYRAQTTVHASSGATPSGNGPSVTVEPSRTSLSVGKTIDLQVVVRGQNGEVLEDVTVLWSSSDSSVATVVGGRVSAVAPGSAIVTAAAEGKSGSAAVTVPDPTGGGGGGGDPTAADRFRAYPEAEGYGAEALMRCDRTNVQVLKVTSTGSTGTGTLRDALGRVDSGRLTIIVFEASGTILASQVVTRGCVYLAGQTAPGEGVQLYVTSGAPAFVVDRYLESSDVVVRYLRFRTSKGEPGGQDAVTVNGGNNIILDHVSAQFGNDEVLSLQPVATTGSRLTNVTVSHSIIAVGLKPHSTGSLITTPKNKPSLQTTSLSLHHNLWAHNAHRNPWVSAVTEIEIVNNVMYNWRGNVGRLRNATTVDIVANTFKAGPWTASQDRESRIFHHDTIGGLSTVYMSRNVAQPFQPSPTGNQRLFLKYQAGGNVVPDQVFVSSPVSSPRFGIEEQSASASYGVVMDQVGASKRLTCAGRWTRVRDALDRRIVTHTMTGTGPASDAEMDHPDDFGGVPSLARGTPCVDQDDDGMPDAFEDRFGLNRADPSDVSADPDGDGYTNIEEYVNGTSPR